MVYQARQGKREGFLCVGNSNSGRVDLEGEYREFGVDKRRALRLELLRLSCVCVVVVDCLLLRWMSPPFIVEFLRHNPLILGMCFPCFPAKSSLFT